MIKNQININEIIDLYKTYYKNIKGGIDGYYEKTILEADCYEVIDQDVIGYFTIHKERGLTSILVIDDFKFETLFDYVLSLPIVTKVLFTECDKRFMHNIKRHKLAYQKQAINFQIDHYIQSKIVMKMINENNLSRVYQQFQDFIEYNCIDINSTPSFFYELDNDIISFGALEPMMLSENRFCIAMIVNDKYRLQGYGTETVKFLINYLLDNQLEVNARCYIKNDASKHTLLKSGLKISNYLYKVVNFK